MITSNKIKTWHLAVVFCGISWFWLQYPASISAQSDYALSVYPPSAYLKIKPGTTANHTIELTNTTTNTIVVTPKVFDSKPKADSGYPEMQPTFSFPYLSEQVQKMSPILIKPGETNSFSLDFTVPPEAITKEYPLTVLFSSTIEQTSTNNQADSNSKLYGVIGANLVVLVSSDETLPNLLQIVDIEVPRLLDSLRGLSFTPMLINQGVQTVVASGSATIVDTFGKTVFQAQIYPDMVLGKQQRSARALMPQKDSKLPEPTVFSYDPLFLLGKYTITTKIIDGQGNSSSSHTKTIIALPYSFLIVVLFIIIGWVFSRVFVTDTSPD
jgi:hypothetical protein